MFESGRSWIAAGLLVLVLGARSARAEQMCGASGAPAPPPACVDGTRTATTSAGMVIYRDPATGAFAIPPANVAAQLSATAQPPQPVERMGITAGGGVLLDHVPMMSMTATVDARGEVSTGCHGDATPGERRP